MKARIWIVGFAVLLVLTGCSTTTKTQGSTSPSATPTHSAAPWWGGLGPESCGPVTHGADGNVSPVVCPNGHPNALVMGTLQSVSPRVMALGPNATQGDIEAALCADFPRSSLPIEQSAFEWQQAAMAWSFGALSSDTLMNVRDSCPNTSN